MKEKPSLMPIFLGTFVLTLFFAAAAEAQSSGAGGILDGFVGRTEGWWVIMRDAARQLFKITAMIEICLFGIRMVIQRSQIEVIVGEFVMVLVYMGFIAVVISNYEEWSKIVALSGLKPLAGKLGGGETFDVGLPSAMIFKIFEGMAPVFKDAGYSDFGMLLLYVVSMSAIVAVFALICLQYILLVCEFHFSANVGLVLIGLGGSKLFKEYAFNVMKYVLSLGIKIFVLTLILVIGFSILQIKDLTTTVGATKSIQGIKVEDLVMLIFQGIILLGLSKTLPETCGGLLSGASVGGGNPLQGMAKAVGAAAFGAATGGAGMAVKSAINAGSAYMGAGADGTKGFARVKQAAKDFGGAVVGSIGAKITNSESPTSTANQLRSLQNARKAGINKP